MSFFHEDDEVVICTFHPERPTQLIWTFAFPYYEWWCPACGGCWGMLGAGRDVKWTPRIHDRYIADKKRSKKYLGARARLNCSQFKYKGKWIEPEKMPVKLRNYYNGIISKWRNIK